MTLRTKILTAAGAGALVVASWGGIAYANAHDLNDCYNSGRLPSEGPPHVPHSRVKLGPDELSGETWYVCVHHISSD